MKKSPLKRFFKEFTIFDAVVTAILLFVLFITLYPVLYVFSISFSSVAAVNSGNITFYPRGFNLEAYKSILSSPKIPQAYMNSILYTSVGTVFSILFTVVTAYPLSKQNLVFRKQIMLFIIITMFFSGGLIPIYLLIRSLGLLDSMWALVLPGFISTFDLLVMKSFFEGVPEEMYEVAHIDGASEIRILFSIYIPISTAAIATIGLLYMMANWNAFLAPSIYFVTPTKYPLQVILREMLLQDRFDGGTNSTNLDVIRLASTQGMKNATIVLTILPMMMIYPFLQKYFAKGIMLGAVKG